MEIDIIRDLTKFHSRSTNAKLKEMDKFPTSLDEVEERKTTSQQKVLESK